MANLDGARSHGGRWDVLAGAMLRDDPARFGEIYRVLLHTARAEGIGRDRLPDFLGLEDGGEFALLGQDELDLSGLEADLREQVACQAGARPWSELETERILLAAARVGQHLFATSVLALLAGHINRGKTAHRPSASIRAMACPLAQHMTSLSTPAC